jgi:hypothetical protein
MPVSLCAPSRRARRRASRGPNALLQSGAGALFETALADNDWIAAAMMVRTRQAS